MTVDPVSSASAPARNRRTALRSFAIGFGLSAAVIAGAGHVAAQPRISHNSDAPVDFDAAHMELQDKQKRVVLTGNVVVTQAELRLTADRTLMAYDDVGKLTLQRVDATGHVVVTRNGEKASGDVAVYDLNRKVITMVGHVVLNRANGDRLGGGRLVTDLNTGISSIDGHGGAPAIGPAGQAPSGPGRVSGSFSVPKKNGANP